MGRVIGGIGSVPYRCQDRFVWGLSRVHGNKERHYSVLRDCVCVQRMRHASFDHAHDGRTARPRSFLADSATVATNRSRSQTMYRAGVAVTVRPTFLYTAVLDAVPGAKSKSDRMEIRRGAAPTDAIPQSPITRASTGVTHGLFEFVGTRPRFNPAQSTNTVCTQLSGPSCVHPPVCPARPGGRPCSASPAHGTALTLPTRSPSRAHTGAF